MSTRKRTHTMLPRAHNHTQFTHAHNHVFTHVPSAHKLTQITCAHIATSTWMYTPMNTHAHTHRHTHTPLSLSPGRLQDGWRNTFGSSLFGVSSVWGGALHPLGRGGSPAPGRPWPGLDLWMCVWGTSEAELECLAASGRALGRGWGGSGVDALHLSGEGASWNGACIPQKPAGYRTRGGGAA